MSIQLLKTFKDPASIAIVVANLVPLLGVVSLAWTIPEMLVMYWIESVVIGIFVIARMKLRAFYRAFLTTGTRTSLFSGSNVTEILGFLLMYGGGLLIMLFFLVLLAGGDAGFSVLATWFLTISYLPVLGLSVSHAIVFWRDFILKKEYKEPIQLHAWTSYHERIIFMLFLFFLAGVLTRTFNLPVVFMAVFVIIKIVVDVSMLYRDRKLKRAV